MFVKKLNLTNFLLYSTRTKKDNGELVEFNLIENQSGCNKSLIEALRIALSWFVERMKNPNYGRGKQINESSINKGRPFASISIQVEKQGKLFDWSILKYRKEEKVKKRSDLKSLGDLVKLYESDNTAHPVIAFYSIDRKVLDIDLKEKGEVYTDSLSIYDDALDAGLNLSNFFKWFFYCESIENETKGALLTDVLANLENEGGVKSVLPSEKDWQNKELTAVRQAWEAFTPDFKFSEFRNMQEGERVLMAMVGDIARRLAIANQDTSNPLAGNGIILIDEVCLNLSENRQRGLLFLFQKTFPNCQFIVSSNTHLRLSELYKG